MYKRIFFLLGIFLSVGVLLGYGRAVLAMLTPEISADGQSVATSSSQMFSTLLWFPDGLTGEITLLEPVRLTAVVPPNVVDGDVFVQTPDGISNPAPFVVGDNFVPNTSGIGSSWAVSFSGPINVDTTWDQNILLTGDVTVAANATLTITPGVTVFFAANSDDRASGLWSNKTEIHIHGRLVAAGTGESPVYFTSNATTPVPEDWGGIIIRRNSTESYIRSCVIQYARFGVAFYVYDETGGNLGGVVSNCLIEENHTGVRKRIFSSGTNTQENISHNLIQNNTTYGVDLATSTGVGTATSQAIVQNNTITGNGTGIYMYVNSWDGGRADDVSTIRNNTIINNSVYGYFLLAAGGGNRTDAQPLIENNLFENNETNLYLFLDRDGGNGSQILWLRPIIQHNTIRVAPKGIAINNNDNVFGTVTPVISHNVFSGFEPGAYALMNQTTRSIVAEENYWGDTESAWNAGAPPAWILGDIEVGNHLDANSPPVVTRIAPGKAFAGEIVTVHGANFGASSDVSLAKMVNTNTALPGQPLTYTLAFTNAGPGVAVSTVITDLVPGVIVNSTFTSSGAVITPTGSLPFVWEVADLTPGTGGVITVTGIISPELLSEMTIVNTAVISNSTDITSTNNSSTAVTQVIIPQINLSASEYVVDEDAGQVVVTAVLSPTQPFLDVSVGYETADGTALAGEDYTTVSGILTFTAGTTEAQILVPILDDQLVEPDEMFSLELSDPVYAILGGMTNATITILDDDTYPEINLSATDYTVLEDGGQAVLTVTLNHPYLEPVSVVYETADGTALADEDYTAVSGILTFTVGMTEASIFVPILDDTVVEGDETFTVGLSDPVHATIGNTAEATVLIVDDDAFPLISLSSDQYVVPEDVGEVVFTVTLSHIYPEPVSLTYETTDGTAVAGNDYTYTSGTLTLSPGTTQATFTVSITDDSQVEGSETFTVSLANLTNATPGAAMLAAVTILDNDEETPPPTHFALYLPLIVRPAPTPPLPAFPIFISAGVAPRPALFQGEVFFTATIPIPADLPPTGQFFLSADPDQPTPVSVDDELAFVLNGQELFVKRFSTDGQTIYPEIVPLPRQTMVFMAGQTVTVVFRDVFSDQVSATSLWIVYIP
ncbi:MAG: DUF11 domain-containing protein [Anaerolineae bacterium]|nr:DUF11 domain-containing protein [Anaerolineae bacterium]